MGREVLLRFGTRNLDKARKAAKEIAKAVRESAKGVQDVKKRRQLLRQARDQAYQDRVSINEERNRQRGDARSRRNRGRARRFGGVATPRFGDPGESLVGFAEGKGGLRAIDVSFRAGAAALEAIPVVGALASETAQLIWEEFGRPFLQRQFELVQEREMGPLLDRLREIEAGLLSQELQEGGRVARQFRESAVDRDRRREREIAPRVKRWVQSSRLTRLSE